MKIEFDEKKIKQRTKIIQSDGENDSNKRVKIIRPGEEKSVDRRTGGRQ